MPTLYEIHVQDAPAKRLVYEQAIRAIARARASKGSPTAAAAGAAAGGVVDPLTALVATFDPANDGRYALEELGGAVALCELGPDDSLGSGGGASSSMAAAAAAGRASSSARAAGRAGVDGWRRFFMLCRSLLVRCRWLDPCSVFWLLNSVLFFTLFLYLFGRIAVV